MLSVKSSKFVVIYLPLIVYLGAIFTSSCFHRVPLPFIDRLSVDKIYHCLEYVPVGFLIFRAFNQGVNLSKRYTIILVIITGALYGLSDEIHQYFVPGRYFSWWDLTANVVGVSIGSWIYRKWGLGIRV
jgi:VanZ family protein